MTVHLRKTQSMKEMNKEEQSNRIKGSKNAEEK